MIQLTSNEVFEFQELKHYLKNWRITHLAVANSDLVSLSKRLGAPGPPVNVSFLHFSINFCHSKFFSFLQDTSFLHLKT